MTGVREGLTNLFAPLPSKWTRVPYPASDFGPANNPVIAYWTNTVSAPKALDGNGRREVTVTLGLWTMPLNDKSEDALDDALDQVLALLDGAAWLTYTEATRAEYANTYTGYQITLTCYTTPED